MIVTQVEFARLADLVRRRSGLSLPPSKLALVCSKLAPVAEHYGFKTVDAMLRELEDAPEELAAAVTEAMTINETSFFRDPDCFDHFRNVILPVMTAARAQRRRLRVWCAAASTGQEPYSLAMLLSECGLIAGGWTIDLFATDLSGEAVARMRAGHYSPHEVQRGLSARYLKRYFTQQDGEWRVAEYLRRSLRIRQFNLLDHFGWLGEIDIIFCRNALFYFDVQDKSETLIRLEKCLADDGCLVLGATESASGCGDLLRPVATARGIFVKSRGALGWQANLAI